jgi:hypothetical protein
MKNKLFLFVFITTLAMLSSCNEEYIDIEKGWWKYGHGYNIGDRVDFDESIEVRNDTIIRNDEAIGKIQFYSKKRMQIKDLKSNETGMYHHKY